MNKLHTKIGDHLIEITSSPANFAKTFLDENQFLIDIQNNKPDIIIHIEQGFGVPFVDYHVNVKKERNYIFFQRADYLIKTDHEYKEAIIYVHDQLALKHALMNLYSSYIVYHNWGLLIHSSCVIEKEKAHIFAGQSGAGKSTAAKLSHPRVLLSDEATLIKINQDEITVFDSPFRSEIKSRGSLKSCSLGSVQLLNQALENSVVQLNKSNSFIHLMDKVFYWAHDPLETRNIVKLLELLIHTVPINNLYFQKNDTFWELIS